MEQKTENPDQAENQVFQLALPLKDINYVLALLAKRKCGDVFHLVYSIHSQIGQQIQQMQQSVMEKTEENVVMDAESHS